MPPFVKPVLSLSKEGPRSSTSLTTGSAREDFCRHCVNLVWFDSDSRLRGNDRQGCGPCFCLNAERPALWATHNDRIRPPAPVSLE